MCIRDSYFFEYLRAVLTVIFFKHVVAHADHVGYPRDHVFSQRSHISFHILSIVYYKYMLHQIRQIVN